MKNIRIPLFIPHLACRHRCCYCNQMQITGEQQAPSPLAIHPLIEQYLPGIPRDAYTEFAFFGGNFTALALPLQEAYLQEVQPYIEKGQIQGIRLSTRPDDINDTVLALLKKYHVKTIELGAQSLDAEVLRLAERGHSKEDVQVASAKIKAMGFGLGLQMMIGLPGDTPEKARFTAEEIIRFKADETRIYPTLVIENTALAQAYRQGDYQALPLEQAVEQSKDLLLTFESAGVKVIRIGLHPSEGLLSGKAYLAGPFHPSFRELVETAIWGDIFKAYFQRNPKQSFSSLYVAPGQSNTAIGYGGLNKKILSLQSPKFRILTNEQLKNREFNLI
ncbi:MAG: radical SAM protein [Bacteroidales bacterium]